MYDNKKITNLIYYFTFIIIFYSSLDSSDANSNPTMQTNDETSNACSENDNAENDNVDDADELE